MYKLFIKIWFNLGFMVIYKKKYLKTWDNQTRLLKEYYKKYDFDFKKYRYKPSFSRNFN